MATKKPDPLFQVGDRVAIRYSDWHGRIVEFRGPLAPGGMYVYRVRVPLKPKPSYIELREDQLVALARRPKGEACPSANQASEALNQQGDGATLPEAKKPTPLYQAGDHVQIHHSDWRGRIVELRGPLAPGGKLVYRVRVPDKPKPIYIEVPEDELTAIPIPPKKKSSPAVGRRGQDGREER